MGGVAFAQQADVAKLLPQLKLPAGFKISVFAKVPNARSMAVSSPLGVVFVGTRYDTVYAVVDRDKDGVADEVIRFATGLKLVPCKPRKKGAPGKRWGEKGQREKAPDPNGHGGSPPEGLCPPGQ